MTKDEELQELKKRLNSIMSLIRMIEDYTPPDELRKIEREWTQEIKDRIAELEKEKWPPKMK